MDLECVFDNFWSRSMEVKFSFAILPNERDDVQNRSQHFILLGVLYSI